LVKLPFQRPGDDISILVADQVEQTVTVVRRSFPFGHVELVLPNLLPMLASRNDSMWKTGKDVPKSLISEALGFDAHVERSPSALPSIGTVPGDHCWSNWSSGNPACCMFSVGLSLEF
jgi:hypothetical protein